jgi:WD40 repeat protein
MDKILSWKIYFQLIALNLTLIMLISCMPITDGAVVPAGETIQPSVLPTNKLDTEVEPDAASVSTYADQEINIKNITHIRNSGWVVEKNAYEFSWLANGEMFAIAAKNKIIIYDLETMTETEWGVIDTDKPVELTVSQNGDQLAWVDVDNNVCVWRDWTSQEPVVVNKSEVPVLSLAFSPDGTKLALSTFENTVEIWDLDNLKMVSIWRFPSWVTDLSYSPEGSLLAVVDPPDLSVYFLETETGESLRTFEWTDSPAPCLNGVYFSPSWGKMAWVAKSAVQIMDIESANVEALLLHEDIVNALSWSPGESLIATASAGTIDSVFSPVVEFWDPTNGELMNRLPQAQVVLDLAFSPNGNELGILGGDGEFAVWSIAK